jgi:hypothetical protein
MRRLVEHLTYANLVSTLALALTLGIGSAYAANQIAPKSVGAKQLRPAAVTADKLRKNSVIAPKISSLAVKRGKIANGAVTAQKISSGAVTAEKLPNGVIDTEKVQDNSITGLKVNEESLGQVPSAARADLAGFAESSNPEAFAKVNEEATVFSAFSKGIGTADVRQGKDPGVYCVNVPGFVPRGAQVTPEYHENNSVSVYVRIGGTESCPYPQVEVQTYNGGGRQKEPFYFVAYH